MKFRLSKNKYSVWIAIVSTLVCCDASCTDMTVKQAINKFNQFSWRMTAHNAIVDASNDSFVKQKKYEESIIKVIGEAIGSCITGMNEFAGREQKDVITFKVTPKDINYTAAHWNAIVLYNYLHLIKCGVRNKTLGIDDSEFEVVRERINQYYTTYGIDDLSAKIDKAINDIKKYSKTLNLKNEMIKIVQTVDPILNKPAKWFDSKTSDYQNEQQGASEIQIAPLIYIYRTYCAKDGRSFESIMTKTPIKYTLKFVLDGSLYELWFLCVYYFWPYLGFCCDITDARRIENGEVAEHLDHKKSPCYEVLFNEVRRLLFN